MQKRFNPDEIRATEISLGRLGKRRAEVGGKRTRDDGRWTRDDRKQKKLRK